MSAGLGSGVDAVAPLVNSDSWDDEWLEAEIARELAGCEDIDTRPSVDSDADAEADRQVWAGGASSSSQDSTTVQGTRSQAQEQPWEINGLHDSERSVSDHERPTKDDSKGQSRHDDAIDALAQYMRQRDAKNDAMEAQMQDDIASVAELAAGVEDGLANVTRVEASATQHSEEVDTPSTSELVNKLQQLSKRSPTGRLANALEQSQSMVREERRGNDGEIHRESMAEGPSWKVAEARQRQLQQAFRETERRLIDFSGSLKDELQEGHVAEVRCVEKGRAGRSLWELAAAGPDTAALNYCGDGVHRFAPPPFELLSGATPERSESRDVASDQIDGGAIRSKRTRAERVRQLQQTRCTARNVSKLLRDGQADIEQLIRLLPY